MNKFNNEWIKKINRNFINFKIKCSFFSTKWLKKSLNEDTIWALNCKNKFIACICDWHWWDEASNIVKKFILSKKNKFPNNEKQWVVYLKKVEKIIFKKYWKNNLNWVTDITPETSLIWIEINQNRLKILSYWDCRWFIINKDSIIEIQKNNSWLWSFSYLWLRNRLPVLDNIYFKKFNLEKWDIIILFTDWVDECVYEKPTISIENILKISYQSITNKKIIKSIFNEVFENWAEDNASFMILKIK